MLFGCIYRSPTHTTESDVNNNNLNALVHHIASDKKYSHICLTGDFNFKINWQQWSTPYPENSKEETLRDSFLYQHVLEPTRRRGTNKPSILDLIFTKEESQIMELKTKLLLEKVITVFYYSASIATLITNYHQKSICTTKPTLKK